MAKNNWEAAIANAQANPDVVVEVEDIPLRTGDEPAPSVSTWDKAVPDQFAARLGQAWSSKTEREAAYWLRQRYGAEAIIRYEPLMFRLPGGNYTPDFMVIVTETNIAQVVFVEVKGSGGFRAHQSGRSSKKALKECAYHYSFMGRWFILRKTDQGWEFGNV